MIEEGYFLFYEGEEQLVEAVWFCMTQKEAEQKYQKWAKFPSDASKLYIAKIIKKPEEA